MIDNRSEIETKEVDFIPLETKFSRANEDRAYIISCIIFIACCALLIVDFMRWQNGVLQSNFVYKIILGIHILMSLFLVPILNKNYKLIAYQAYSYLGTNSLITFILCCSILFPLGFMVSLVRNEIATFLLCIAIINLVFETHFRDKLILNGIILLIILMILFFVRGNPFTDNLLLTIIFLSVISTSLILAKFQHDLKLKSHKNELILFQQNQLLHQQNNVIEKKNHELRSFAYASSHDLKEPLRMIGSYTGLLKRKLNNHLDDDTKEYMGYITGGVQNMNKLVDELLKYATIDNYTDEHSTVDLSDTFILVQNNMRAVIHDTNSIIEFKSKLPRVRLPSTLSSQLFQNILSNAIKFRKPDVPPFIIIDSKIEKNHAIISVKDNGIGIPKDDIPKIFDIFNKVHQKEEFEGHGIGLASCLKIIERVNGKIWVESEIDSGSCFFIKLPVSMEQQGLVVAKSPTSIAS